MFCFLSASRCPQWQQGEKVCLYVKPVQIDRHFPKARPAPQPHTTVQEPLRSNQNGLKHWLSKKAYKRVQTERILPGELAATALGAPEAPGDGPPGRYEPAARGNAGCLHLLRRTSKSASNPQWGESAYFYRFPQEVYTSLLGYKVLDPYRD